MKNWLLLLSLWAINAVAQQDSSWEVNHYKETKTFVEDGYTYQCDVTHAYVTLYNKENKWIYKDQIDKRTGEKYMVDLETAPSIGDHATQKLKDILNNAFSREEAQRFADDSFIIILYINPTTGNVDEIRYNFFTFDACAKIPISYYRDIEVKVKEQIHADVAEETKYLNYILAGGAYAPTGRLPSINQ